MLTLEFSVQLTEEQKTIAGEWMDSLKHQWNLGLSALEEFDRFSWYNKHDKKPALCCPIAEGEWIKEEKRVASTCSLIRDPAPKLTSSALQTGGDSLGTMARSDRLPEFLQQVPSKFRMGMLALLSVSWDAYIKDRKNKGKPKYKRRRDRWDVLYSGNLKDGLSCNGDILKGIPKLGTVVVPKLNQRWKTPTGETPPICAFKLLRDGDKFKVQLTGELQRSYKAKPSDLAVGIDLGFVYSHILSDGERSPLLSKSESKLENRKQLLQSQLDAKIDQRLTLWLHHPDTGFEQCRELIRVSVETWEKIRECRVAGEVAQIIGQKRDKRYMSLRHKLPKSKAEKQLRHQIKNLDRKLADTRKSKDEKLATRLVKKFGHVAIENGLQRQELRERPDPVPNESNGHDPNGANAQSEVNKQLKALAPGRKISIIEQRAKRYGRSFVKAESQFTTQECPVCGSLNQPSLKIEETGDRAYHCNNCGWHCDQDLNAAINIELRSFAFVPQVVLTLMAERARVMSYQKEGDGKIPVNPSWRGKRSAIEGETDSRTKKSKGSSDSGGRKGKEGAKLKAASRKSQSKAIPKKGSEVLQ